MSPENINSEQIVQIIREKVRQRKGANFQVADRALPNTSDVFPGLLDALKSSTREIAQQVPSIGQPTPSPPTIRGRFGRALMRVISHTLWWYSYQLKAFAAAIQRVLQQQTKTLEALIDSTESLRASMVPLEGQVSGSRAEVAECRRDLERTSARLKELEAAQASFRSHYDSAIEPLRDSVAKAAKQLHTQEQVAQQLFTQVQSLTASLARLEQDTQARLAEEAGAREGLQQCLTSFRAELGAMLSQHGTEVQSLTTSLARLEQEAQARLAEEASAREGLQQCLTSFRAELGAMLSQHGTEVQSLTISLARLEQEAQARLVQEANVRAEVEQRLSLESRHIANLESRLSELGAYTHHTRTQFTLQDRRISLLIEEARKRLPVSNAAERVQSFVAKDNHRHDGIYLAFENVFRGSREEVKRRQSVYLPMFQEHNIGSASMPILDLGCGRGEWLEILRENGMHGRGLDRNEAMLAICRDLGLDVVEGEALAHLRGLPDASLGAVTSFHMIEHIPFNTAIDLIDEAVRVLKSGGILILETPNPQNVLVGSHNFYYDPTHLRPLPSGLLYFFVEARGFCNVQIKELHPFPDSVRLPEEGMPLAQRFNTYFYGPQDYAVIGHKP